MPQLMVSYLHNNEIDSFVDKFYKDQSVVSVHPV